MILIVLLFRLYHNQMDINDNDDEEDLATKIKHFIAKHTNFRDPNFDPAPYLIKVLKEK